MVKRYGQRKSVCIALFVGKIRKLLKTFQGKRVTFKRYNDIITLIEYIILQKHCRRLLC